MSTEKVRALVLKRHSKFKSHLVLCDAETGQMLGGLTGVQLNCDAGNPAIVTATFEAFGANGVRLEDDDQINQSD